jgi:hypothetical protein
VFSLVAKSTVKSDIEICGEAPLKTIVTTYAYRGANDPDPKFIAHFNPKKIEEMLDLIEKLEKENYELKRQLSNQRDNNHRRNVELDALHYVWCDGGCKSGVHRWSKNTITQEVVDAAVRNTNRLVAWYSINCKRKQRDQEI